MRNTLSNWITNAIYVSAGTKLSYEGRMWMPALFDTQAEEGRIFKMSRQVGKSTSGSAEALARLCKFVAYNILYVAPEMDHARKFSQDKVKPMIEESAIIKSQLGIYNNVHEKEFAKGGKYYLKFAKDNADRCRGITADMVHYDEVQDMFLRLLEPVINESLFTSMHAEKLYTGTPKSFANPIHKKWVDSDQREWLVACDHHSPKKYVRLGIRNIGLKGPICHHCGNLLDVDQGIWVAHNPGSHLAGFHVHQLHCKISHASPKKWREIVNKRENYPRDKLLNEVLGESADSAEKPITEKLLRECCEGGVRLDEKPDIEFMSYPRYAGIDWGHGVFTTALTIGQFHANGKFRVIFMKVYEGEQCEKKYCVPDMARIINAYRCKRVHVDYGGGYGMWDDLDKSVKAETTGMMWTSAEKARWKRTNAEGVAYSIPMLSMNKVRAATSFINNMHDGKIQLPAAVDFFRPKYNANPTLPSNKDDSIRTFAQHFLNVRKEVEVDEVTDKNKTRFVREGMDDALQATIYAWAIALIDSRSLLDI